MCHCRSALPLFHFIKLALRPYLDEPDAIAALAGTLRALNSELVEFAFNVTKDEIGSGTPQSYRLRLLENTKLQSSMSSLGSSFIFTALRISEMSMPCWLADLIMQFLTYFWRFRQCHLNFILFASSLQLVAYAKGNPGKVHFGSPASEPEWLRTYRTTTGWRCWKNGSPRLKNESGWLQRKIESICAHQLMTPRYPK